MPLIPSPSTDTADRFDNGVAVEVSTTWRNFFSAVFSVLNAMTQSGATTARPTTFLWVGRPYFDTTLGLPIWYDGTQWVDATGAPA
jgi:hypothetical protein